jgi:hypothetical protein
VAKKGDYSNSGVVIGETYQNNIGQSFKVTSYEGHAKVGVIFEDGFERFVQAGNIKKGAVRHTGHYVTVGQKFVSNQGCEYVVIEKISDAKIKVKFLDDYSHEKWVANKEIKAGKVKNPFHPEVCGVGYFGVGDYAGTFINDEGKKTNSPAYEVWRGILRRCYDQVWLDSPRGNSYQGCSTDSRWHNFQAFAEWFYNHKYYNVGWHVDKDIIFRDNRIYGPDTCTLIPHQINVLTTNSKAARGKYPVGVYYKKDVGKFRAQIAKFDQNQKMLVESKDPHVCFLAYKAAKEEYMSEVATIWEGRVDQRVVDSLNNWTVREND